MKRAGDVSTKSWELQSGSVKFGEHMDHINAMDDDEARASEELREVEDRKPSPYPKLLMWTLTRGQNAKIIPSSLATMVGDYFEFARSHPMPATVHEQDLDRRLLPLLFVYRHATELALKYCIAQLIFHIRQREADFEDAVPEHHGLGALLDMCRTLYEKAKVYRNEMGTLDFLSKQAQDFIRELDSLDPSGEAFRYSHQKRKKTTGEVKAQIRTEVDVSVEALRAGMLHIEKEVLWLMQMTEITCVTSTVKEPQTCSRIWVGSRYAISTMPTDLTLGNVRSV